ncbi:MAG: hypothetical protein ACRDGF_01785 [Chloroflexota bacterium]
MSELVRLLRFASHATTRATAGFGARAHESKRRLVLIASLPALDAATARQAAADGADVLEVPLTADGSSGLRAFIEGLDVPIGGVIAGPLPPTFDGQALEGQGLDYVKVEAGDVPAAVFLISGVAVVLELKDALTENLLKALNFLPERAVQVDAPDSVEGFTVRELMEKRVDRELVRKPLLMKVGSGIKPAAAQLLTLIAPNALVVPAGDVAAWSAALADLKDLEEEEEEDSRISLKVPAGNGH